MAGILELLIRPQKMAMHDRKAMELQTAKEILAEVFSVRITEVDEMISNHFLDCHEYQKETGLWPQEFRLGE